MMKQNPSQSRLSEDEANKYKKKSIPQGYVQDQHMCRITTTLMVGTLVESYAIVIVQDD